MRRPSRLRRGLRFRRLEIINGGLSIKFLSVAGGPMAAPFPTDRDGFGVHYYAAAVQAEHYRGKAVGLYEDRLRVSASISDADLVEAIDNLLGAEIAKAVGTKLGVSEGGSEESMAD